MNGEVCPAHCEREPAAVAVGTGVHPLGSPICPVLRRSRPFCI